MTPAVRRASWRAGVADAIGVPIAVLGSGFVGYGAMASDAGYSVWVSIFATVAIWALPGQLVLYEMHAAGAAAFAIVPAVMLTAARFLPMTITLMPVMRRDRAHPAWHYAAAHFVSMTTWAVAMQKSPELPQSERLVYFCGFSAACILACAIACAVGYFISGTLPAIVRLGLVFLTPVYFVVLLVGDARDRSTVIALLCGGAAGPLFHLLDPQWSVLLAGLAGGSLAYALQRAAGQRHG